MQIVTADFRVMASTTRVIAVGPAADALVYAKQRLRALERAWSRFLPDSDIARLNRASEGWTEVGPDTLELVRTMQLGSSLTAGAYDPTVLRALLDVGYTSSIDDPAQHSVVVDLPCPDQDVLDVRVDAASSTVWLPAGLALDAGGIGKGLAADLVVTELLAAGTCGALVSVGGDMAARGQAPTDAGWIVEIRDPLDRGPLLATMTVSEGGVATSSTRTRRWTHEGVSRHHVIDPATRISSRTDLVAATVVARSGWLAEVHATAALLRGSEGAVGYMEEQCISGTVTTLDGHTIATPDLSKVTSEAA